MPTKFWTQGVKKKIHEIAVLNIWLFLLISYFDSSLLFFSSSLKKTPWRLNSALIGTFWFNRHDRQNIYLTWRHAATCWWNSNLVAGAHFFSTMGSGLNTSHVRLRTGLQVLLAHDHDNGFFKGITIVVFGCKNMIVCMKLLHFPFSRFSETSMADNIHDIIPHNIVSAWMCKPYSCTYDYESWREVATFSKIWNRRSCSLIARLRVCQLRGVCRYAHV